MSESIRLKQEELQNIIKVARGYVTEEQVRDKMELEDGVMREIK